MTVFLFMRLYVKKFKLKLLRHQHLSECWISFMGGEGQYLPVYHPSNTWASPSHTFLSPHFLFYIMLSSSAFLHLPPSPISLPWPILSFIISPSLFCLHLISFSSSSFSLRWSVQQGWAAFQAFLPHMVHIPAGFPRGPVLCAPGPAGTSLHSDSGMSQP